MNNFALEPYSKSCSCQKLFVNRNVCQISRRFEEANNFVPGIIDLPKFNYEDSEVIIIIVTVQSPSDGLLLQPDRVHLEFMGNASRYIITKFAVEDIPYSTNCKSF